MISSSGMCPAKIMLVGEAPSAEEMVAKIAFAGYSMYETQKMLSEAGIQLSDCFRTHVLRIKPFGDNVSSFIAVKKKEITPDHVLFHGKHILPLLRDHILMLRRDIEMCQPNVIIAFGNTALWALTGEWGVTSWRGSLLECALETSLDYKPKVIPVFAPTMVQKVYSWRPIMLHDLRKAKKESSFKELIRAEYKFVIQPSYEEVILILKQLYDQTLTGKKKLAVDIETKYWHIECIALAWNDREAICIPLIWNEKKSESIEITTHYWTLEQEANILFALYQLLSHENCEVIGQNFIYDDQYIYEYWMFPTNLTRDTMIAQHSMFSSMQKSLSFLSSMYLSHHIHWKEEGKGEIPNHQRWIYNCKDAVSTYEIDTEQRKTVEIMKLAEVEKFQQSLYHPVIRAMRKGIKVDKAKRDEFDKTLCDLIVERENYLREILGYLPNINSTPQMQDLFYRLLNQPKRFNRKTGAVSCDDEALTKLAAKEPILIPIVRCISEMRTLGVFLNTFVRAELEWDGRIKTEYNLAHVETYRFNSSHTAFNRGGNLQNVPDGKRSTLALPNLREMYVPDPGHTYFDIDLDSADLRIVVAEADISEMRQMLDEGKKIYVEVMKEYFKNPAMTKHDKEYTMFKSLCHGTHYLGTAKGLAERIGLLVHEVEVIQKWYFGKFPNLKIWQDYIKNQVISRKMVSNVFGYRCYFFDRIEGTIFNQAIAWIPQSTVACIVNRAMVTLHNQFPNQFKKVQFDVLQHNHDSLAGQFPTEQKEFYVAAVKKAMEVELPYKNPIIIPAEVHTSEISWGHCK